MESMSNSGDRHTNLREQRSHESGPRNLQVTGPLVDVQAPLPIIQTSETGSASTFSTLTRSRQDHDRRRDHDLIGRRLEAALQELDEQTSALTSVLQEPLPQIGDDEVYFGTTSNDGDLPRWPKRRKIENDSLLVKIPKYDYEGRVVPGRLRMEVESCDSGAYGGGLPLPHSASQINEVLRENNLVFSTESSRCNLVLKHVGDAAFTLTDLVIKSPTKGYDGRLQEGLVFVSMDRQGLIYRTERYDMRPEDSKPKKSKRQRRRSQEQPDAQVSTSGRHNSWQQSHTMQGDDTQRASVAAQTGGAEIQASPTSPQLPYGPTYLGFNVISSNNLEIVPSRDHAEIDTSDSYTQSRLEMLSDLFDRTIAASRRLDDQRVSAPQRSRLQEGMHQSHIGTNVGVPQIAHRSTETMSNSSQLSSLESSDNDDDGNNGDDDNNDDNGDDDDDDIDDRLGIRRGNQQASAYRENRSHLSDAVSRTTRHVSQATFRLNSEGLPVIDNSGMDAALRQRLLRVWRHGARYRLLLEPRQVEWVPNKVKRDGLGEGPSGISCHAPQLEGTLDQNFEASKIYESPLQPHARFFIPKEQKGVALRFEPPVSGRYILVKMFSPPGVTNIDVEVIAAYGFAGPRNFPALGLR